MDNEKILELFNNLVSGKFANSKFQLMRIYGACEREQEAIKKNKFIDEKLKDSNRGYVIHRISDDMAIIQYREDIFNDGTTEWYCPSYNDKISHDLYNTFDKALIAAVSMKTNNSNAAEYIFKMLDMEGKENNVQS